MDAFDNMFLPGAGTDTGSGLPSGEGLNMNFDGYSFDTNTVSPHELHADSLIMSNPASTAFPNLSTPESSLLDSPTLASSGLNTSPLELLDSTLDFDDSMPSLFPDQFGTLQSDNFHQSASFSAVKAADDARSSKPSVSTSTSPMVRQKSSPGRPPAPYPAIVHTRKHSDTAGVHKVSNSTVAAKPRKALPEITIEDEDDRETAKRKKNTAAARKSRQRKADMFEEMAAEIDRLRNIIVSLGADPDTYHLG
ncbi:hypothetical protein DV737_g444, partial [Chaetothyriales sp. CBS 132003]